MGWYSCPRKESMSISGLEHWLSWELHCGPKDEEACDDSFVLVPDCSSSSTSSIESPSESHSEESVSTPCVPYVIRHIFPSLLCFRPCTEKYGWLVRLHYVFITHGIIVASNYPILLHIKFRLIPNKLGFILSYGSKRRKYKSEPTEQCVVYLHAKFGSILLLYLAWKLTF